MTTLNHSQIIVHKHVNNSGWNCGWTGHFIWKCVLHNFWVSGISKNLFSVSALFIDKHKGKHFQWPIKFFNYKASNEFLGKTVTGNECWAHHFTPEMKRSSLHWKQHNSPTPPERWCWHFSSTNKALCILNSCWRTQQLLWIYTMNSEEAKKGE